MRVVVFLNEKAGTMEAGANDIRAEVLFAFEKCGISAEIELLGDTEPTAAVKQVLANSGNRSIDAIVAGGGDGTIGAVASALVDTDVPLGVLPLGTLNHFAKDLGIPLNLQAAVNVIAAAHYTLIDVGEVNGRIFLNNSSVGIYPYMVVERENTRRREGLKKWTAMMLASLKALRLFPLRRLRIHAAGWSEDCRTPFLFVGNNKYGLDLRGLGKRERLDTGKLWIYVAKQCTRLSLIWFTFRCFIGLTDSTRDLSVFSADSVEIDSPTKHLNVATDGEVEVLHCPLHYRIRPAALCVYVPITENSPQAVS